jgi:hypothetical protein
MTRGEPSSTTGSLVNRNDMTTQTDREGNEQLPGGFPLALKDVQPRIRDMADSIYSLRAFDRMLVLGRELEASGCADPDLVSHCINARVHARGCWALDRARGLPRGEPFHREVE